MKITYVIQYKWPEHTEEAYSDFSEYQIDTQKDAEAMLQQLAEKYPCYTVRMIRRETSETVIETRETTQ